MENVAAALVTGGMAVLFAVLAVQFRRGRWLNLIAGNNYVTREGMRAPEQRLLGRRVARVMWAGAAMCLFLVAMSAADAAGAEQAFAACSAGCGASVAVMVALIAYTMAKGVRERRAALDAELAAGTVKPADAHLERTQTVVVLVFVAVMVAVFVGLSLYAHFNA